MTELDLDGVCVAKDTVEILHSIDLSLASGEVLGVVGASGSGKTTLLRALAGLDPLSAGRIRFGQTDVTDADPAQRNVGVVFQTPVLYPRRTVDRNIAFPLELRRAAADEIRRRVGAEARALHIDGLLRASPKDLSAGEAQLVQIAKAMVRAPDVLLLDEPFAHLDAHRAADVRRELMLIQRGFGVTTVIATNDPVDAMTCADRLAVVERGRVTQIGVPLDVYEHPNTASAALMTGDANVIEVRVDADAVGSWLVHSGFRVRSWAPAVRRHHGRRLQLVVRPEWWSLDPNGLIEVRVDRSQRLGRNVSLWCRVGDRPVAITMRHDDLGTITTDDVLRLRLDRHVLLDPLDGFAIG